MIGGGPTLDQSEAQIEINVNWVLEVLSELSPDADVRVYFANGLEPGDATYAWSSVPEGSDPLLPLARAFQDHRSIGTTYRPHGVNGVLGSTRAEDLIPALEEQFQVLEPGDSGLLVYNGHGSWETDHARNGLRLWDETGLSVREFERLLSLVDPEIPIRFIFTQCYSGAFERAVHPGAADVLELADGERCGFLAESEDRESEGCSATIVIGDYRDYTTYFFAALDGETRLGEPLAGDPDLDGNGSVTPFEAHLYTLAEGYNGDLPRSTSEVFLERWQPWYLRWIGTDRIPDNVYGRVAHRLAEANDLPTDGSLGRETDRRYRELIGRTAELEKERQAVQAEVDRISAAIVEGLDQQWPANAQDATWRARFSDEEAESASAFVARHPEYPDLVKGQDRLERLESELVDVDRRTAQLEKLSRTRVLARALEQLERHGSERARRDYWRLRDCESLPIGNA